MGAAATAGKQAKGWLAGGHAHVERREQRPVANRRNPAANIRAAARRVPAAARGTAPAAAPAVAGGRDANRQRRRVIVFGGLVGVMTMTGALLMAMQPAPLTPDAVKSLMAVETSAHVDALFDTQTPVRDGRWKYVYVHHSGSATGNASVLADAAGPAASLPDHFVIGNGEGAGDGEIQVGRRWDAQQPAGRMPGLDRVDPDCVSICMVGDFDRSPPTPRQMSQLGRLVAVLQDRLRINQERVWIVETNNSPAGCGRYFPRDAFRGGLLP